MGVGQGEGAGRDIKTGGDLMWAPPEDQKLAIEQSPRVLNTGKEGFRFTLKVSTHANYIFKNLAICWWGKERFVLFCFSNTRKVLVERSRHVTKSYTSPI